MMSIPTIRNVFLSPAFLAALLASSGGGSKPTPPPKTPGGGNGAVVVNTLECDPAAQTGDLCQQDIAQKISDFRQQDFPGQPPLQAERDIGGIAHDHAVDMINGDYAAIPTNDNPPKTLQQQLKAGPQTNLCTFGGGNIGTFVRAKTIILVGCFGGNTVQDIWNVIKSDPALIAIALEDWDAIGADVHHPDDGTPGIGLNPPPGILRRNYWQIIFIKYPPGGIPGGRGPGGNGPGGNGPGGNPPIFQN